MNFSSRYFYKSMSPQESVSDFKSSSSCDLAAKDNLETVFEDLAPFEFEKRISISIREFKEMGLCSYLSKTGVVVPQTNWGRPENAWVPPKTFVIGVG